MNKSELIKLYRTKTSIELVEIFDSINDYSKEAKSVIQKEVDSRGGIGLIRNEYEEIALKEQAVELCYEKISHLLAEGKTKQEIRKSFELIRINEEEFNSIFEESKHKYEEIQINKKVTFKSLLGGIIGGSIGSLIGGAIWGFMMVGSNRIFFIMVIGLVLNSYFFVWLFSRKDKHNAGTVIFTIISVLIALAIGQAIYEILGPLEYLN